MAASSVALHFPHKIPRTKLFVPKRLIFQAYKGEKASLVAAKQRKIAAKEDGLNLASFLLHIKKAPLAILKPPDTDTRSWALNSEIVVDQAIINCRFFTLIAVVGSLVGSILCFVEGCFLILESYIEEFHIITRTLDHGRMAHMLIEAIDMFIVGTAMLSFGMGLYSMFAGFKRSSQRSNGCLVHESNPLGFSHLKMLSSPSQMSSISQAKSRIGHAVVMLLQVGLIEKFKNVPLTTGLDLACFAGALLLSSVSMFLLSRLHCDSEEQAAREAKLTV